MISRFRFLAPLTLVCAAAWPAPAADLSAPLKALHAVGPKAAGNRAAAQAWQQLVTQATPADLPGLLAALDQAEPLPANWIRAAIDAVAERTLTAGAKLPQADLERFALDVKHAPRARRLAYEWLSRGDASAPDRLIPGFLHDPSVEFRRDAVARLIAEAPKATDAAAQKAQYEKAFAAARDEDQVKDLTAKLKELGVAVDLNRHYGYLLDWQLIGPFDNTDEKGFHVIYPPEQELKLEASYPGKTAGEKVKWQPFTSTHETGLIDLNTALGKHKGAAAYALHVFEADAATPIELRLKSIVATKVWLNGALIDQHDVYHSGDEGLDQYISRGHLVPGKNTILVKCCQNEQTEPWAQRWEFRLRVCDSAGTAILSKNRK